MNAHLTDQQLNAYLHQTLTNAQRETLDAHLTGCPSCRTQLSDMDVLQQRVHRELSAELRAVSVPLSLTFETIEPQLKRQRSFNRPVTRSRSFTLLALAISAVMVVVVVNLFTRTNFLATPSAQPMLSTTSTPFAMPDKATLVDSVLARTRSLPGNRVFQGETILLALLWYIPSPTGTEYSCFVHALDQQGRMVVLADLSLDRGEFHYPTDPAPNFETFPGVHVPLPYDLAPGQYQIIAGIDEAKSGQRLTLAQGGTTVTIGTIEIDAWLIHFGNGTVLVKSAFNDMHFKPGDTLTVDLSWHISDAEGYTSFVHVLDSQNQVVAQAELSLAAIKASNVREQPNAPYPIGQSKIQLPTDLPDGEYQIAVGIYDDQTGQRVTTYQDETAVPIGTIEVVSPLAHFGNVAALTDVQWKPAELTPDGTVELALQWTISPTDLALTSFVPMLDAQGNLVTQADQPLPETASSAQSIILQLPETLTDGTYQLVVGVYDPATGSRLTTDSGETQISVTTFQVK